MKKKIFSFLLILTAVLIVFAGCKTPLEQHMDKGNSYFDNEKWDEAIIEYSTAIEIDVNNAEAYANRGASYAEKGMYELSIPDYSKAIELDPQNIIVHYNRAIAYNNLEEYDKAIADCTKIIEEFGLKNNWVYFQRGIAHFGKGRSDYVEALNDFYNAKKQSSNEDFKKMVDPYIQTIENAGKGL